MSERQTAAQIDVHERDSALADDTALVAYERKWARRLARLQRAHPGRWRVPGLSDEELRDELTLRLIDAVRTQPEERAQEQPGKEWGLFFLERQLARLRSAFKLKIVLAEPAGAIEHGLNEEERLLERESERLFATARERAERSLSQPQRRWLAAMKMSANAGAFFEQSGKPNLAAASRLLEKNRSSAQRAFGELSRVFTNELRKSER
jgi:hypothetical protein